MGIPAEALTTEESRVRTVYSRRPVGELYSRFNPGCLFMAQERERRFLKLLSQYGCTRLDTKEILEIGCGTGDLLREFVQWGANPKNVTGIDVIPDRILEAARLCPDTMWIERCNAATLHFPDGYFDLVVQATVFTSVLDSEIRRQIASEMVRVLKSDGLILWYDFHMNNPNNPNVRGVKAREIERLFPDCEIHLERIILAPPVTRFLAPYAWHLCYALSKLPWLCTHYAGVLRRRKRG